MHGTLKLNLLQLRAVADVVLVVVSISIFCLNFMDMLLAVLVAILHTWGIRLL